MNGEPRSICRVGATLGEGPMWLAAEQALWFVDIAEQALFRLHPASGALRRWDAPAKPGWVMPAEGGALIVGLATGLHLFSPDDGTFEVLAKPELAAGDRLNDATVGADGSLWFGTMDDAGSAATGRVFRFREGRVAAQPLAPVPIVNGPALSPDGATLYHVDTLARRIKAVPVGRNGVLGTPAPFVTIEAEAGYPDGPTVDAEGYVWVGLYAGWAARRYAPDGTLVETVRFPVPHVTKLAFGGDDLRTVYATTARQGLDAAALDAQPFAGDVFMFRSATPGLPTPAIRWRAA